MKVYLAGKVGGKKWDLVKNLDHVFTSSDADAVGFCPTTQDFRECNQLYKEPVKQVCLEAIGSSHFLLAYLDTPDSYGSIAEIAVASTLGMKSHVIVHPACTVQQMRDAYWFVCSFPDVYVRLVSSWTEAREACEKILKGECHG